MTLDPAAADEWKYKYCFRCGNFNICNYLLGHIGKDMRDVAFAHDCWRECKRFNP